jgi:hypothetical protein
LYVSVVNNRKNLNQPTLLGVRENLQDVQKRFEPFSALDPLVRSSERGFSTKGRKLTRNPAELQQRAGFFERDFPVEFPMSSKAGVFTSKAAKSDGGATALLPFPPHRPQLFIKRRLCAAAVAMPVSQRPPPPLFA